MKISVITPSYNSARFLERTIESIHNQGFADIEHLVIDGGSTDGTLEILRRNDHRVRWVSEPDNGQSDAINKGLRMSTGDIVAFLNADDTYEPGALTRVADYFEQHPHSWWVYGKCRIINEHDREIRRPITWYKNLLLRKYSYAKLLCENFISQPATFWRRELHDEVGYLNEHEHFTMDYEFWLRLGRRYPPGVIEAYLANFRMYTDSKSGSLANPQFEDELRIAKAYSEGTRWPILLHQINYFKIVWIYRSMAAVRRWSLR